MIANTWKSLEENNLFNPLIQHPSEENNNNNNNKSNNINTIRNIIINNNNNNNNTNLHTSTITDNIALNQLSSESINNLPQPTNMKHLLNPSELLVNDIPYTTAQTNNTSDKNDNTAGVTALNNQLNMNSVNVLATASDLFNKLTLNPQNALEASESDTSTITPSTSSDNLIYEYDGKNILNNNNQAAFNSNFALYETNAATNNVIYFNNNNNNTGVGIASAVYPDYSLQITNNSNTNTNTNTNNKSNNMDNIESNNNNDRPISFTTNIWNYDSLNSPQGQQTPFQHFSPPPQPQQLQSQLLTTEINLQEKDDGIKQSNTDKNFHIPHSSTSSISSVSNVDRLNSLHSSITSERNSFSNGQQPTIPLTEENLTLLSTNDSSLEQLLKEEDIEGLMRVKSQFYQQLDPATFEKLQNADSQLALSTLYVQFQKDQFNQQVGTNPLGMNDNTSCINHQNQQQSYPSNYNFRDQSPLSTGSSSHSQLSSLLDDNINKNRVSNNYTTTESRRKLSPNASNNRARKNQLKSSGGVSNPHGHAHSNGGASVSTTANGVASPSPSSAAAAATLESANLYKTELCEQFLSRGSCPYGAKCQFAHGAHELKPVQRAAKFKTKDCANWVKTGTCRYGKRCLFRHGNE
ncbi:hypothetical protein BVG19_g1160 [[Candida] boidinii]|nr:hypothetical protein BVG19_g1160 [[Candida] boidinii]OWB50178.1 metal ion binding protein [[Candida] boidinii]